MNDAANSPLSGDSQGHNLPAEMASSAIPHQSEGDPAAAPKAASNADGNRGSRRFAAAASRAAATPPGADRRRRRRALISAPVRVRGTRITEDCSPDEIAVTMDVSRIGLLFLTQETAYQRGMDVLVTFPYSASPTAIHAEQPGRVARVVEMANGRRAVALALGKVIDEGEGTDLVDSCGRTLVKAPEPVAKVEILNAKKTLILAVDADGDVRDALKAYLMNEGYEVIAVSNCADAREVLNIYTPALLIAEVEGEGLPGFELCAHVKSTDRLQKVPVVLTTRSGYPSDYSNAHSLGAVVCMSKPYKQERLGHVVKLLAPTPQAKLQPGPSPRACNSSAANVKSETVKRSWFRL
jgi:CheY-like chemotaxis protein